MFKGRPLLLFSIVITLMVGPGASAFGQPESADRAAAIEKTVGAYTAAWNEEDEAKRAALLELAWAEDGIYADPSARVEGREALARHIGSFQQQMSGAQLALASGIDSHHGTSLRFRWRMTSATGQVLAEGMDFGQIDEDGKLKQIVGFFGPFPELK